jgi:hypothetical protein
MLKRLRCHEVALGALLASAAWAVVFVLTSDASAHYEICEPAKEGAKECASYNIITFTLRKIGMSLDIFSAFITAIATAFIARYTLTLKRSTDKLWTSGEKQFALSKETSDRQNIEVQNQLALAKEAGRAAQKSADAAVAAERARFYIVIRKHNLTEFLVKAARYPNSPTMPFSFEPFVEYEFKNYGKTPGIISEVSHGMIVHQGPPDPVYQVSSHLFVENMIAAGGVTEPQKFDGPVLFDTIEDTLPILMGQKQFWFYGRFDYADVFGNSQVHRFLMRYVKTGLQWGFQPYDYKHYNNST